MPAVHNHVVSCEEEAFASSPRRRCRSTGRRLLTVPRIGQVQKSHGNLPSQQAQLLREFSIDLHRIVILPGSKRQNLPLQEFPINRVLSFGAIEPRCGTCSERQILREYACSEDNGNSISHSYMRGFFFYVCLFSTSKKSTYYDISKRHGFSNMDTHMYSLYLIRYRQQRKLEANWLAHRRGGRDPII